MSETVVDTAVEMGQRIGKGWLNGTTRKQSYQILAVTAGLGVISGVSGTTYYIKRKFNLVPKFKKVELAPVPPEVIDID